MRPKYAMGPKSTPVRQTKTTLRGLEQAWQAKQAKIARETKEEQGKHRDQKWQRDTQKG